MSKTKPDRPERMKFGWCNDGNHSLCRVSYVCTMGKRSGETMRCECECHEATS